MQEKKTPVNHVGYSYIDADLQFLCVTGDSAAYSLVNRARMFCCFQYLQQTNKICGKSLVPLIN